MIGTIINIIAVIVGSTLGMIFHKGIPTRVADAMMKALGLSTIFIGVQGAFDSFYGFRCCDW